PGVGGAGQGAVLGDHQRQQQAGSEGGQGAQGLAKCLSEGGAAGAAVNKRGGSWGCSLVELTSRVNCF
ncbi:hypothetical protein ACSZN0_14295, partial [Aeromonas caviae]